MESIINCTKSISKRNPNKRRRRKRKRRIWVQKTSNVFLFGASSFYRGGSKGKGNLRREGNGGGLTKGCPSRTIGGQRDRSRQIRKRENKERKWKSNNGSYRKQREKERRRKMEKGKAKSHTNKQIPKLLLPKSKTPYQIKSI